MEVTGGLGGCGGAEIATRLNSDANPLFCTRVRGWCVREIGAMAVFYLSVRVGDELIRDERAYEFPTAQDARDVAIHAVHELIAANPDDVDIEQREIEIADATGHAITVVSLREVAPWRG